jgi:hypothetical protein
MKHGELDTSRAGIPLIKPFQVFHPDQHLYRLELPIHGNIFMTRAID